MILLGKVIGTLIINKIKTRINIKKLYCSPSIYIGLDNTEVKFNVSSGAIATFINPTIYAKVGCPVLIQTDKKISLILQRIRCQY